jgi:hypothetical protein
VVGGRLAEHVDVARLGGGPLADQTRPVEVCS